MHEVASSIDDDRWCHFLGTIELARKLQAEYSNAGLSFDVLDVRLCDSTEVASEESARPGFAGFDVSTFTLRSVIYEELLFTGGGSVSDELTPLFRVFKAHFIPRLNQSGLFSEFTDAVLLRDAVMALETIAPSSFVPEWGELCVFGLTVVPPAHSTDL